MKPDTTANVVELSVSEEAKARLEKQLLDETWQRIYDYAARGDGACGFKAFKAALDKEWNAAIEAAAQAAEKTKEVNGDYLGYTIADAIRDLRRA